MSTKVIRGEVGAGEFSDIGLIVWVWSTLMGFGLSSAPLPARFGPAHSCRGGGLCSVQIQERLNMIFGKRFKNNYWTT